MSSRRVLQLVLIFLSLILRAFARDPFSLSGTVTNTTNPKKEISASATISFNAEGSCVLLVGAPLYGSGSCWVEAYDEANQSLSIRSTGPVADIVCTGT